MAPAEPFYEFHERRVQWRYHFQYVAVSRVREFQLACVQQQSAGIQFSLKVTVVSAPAVFGVTDDWVVNVFQVPANLMLAAGMGNTFHQ